MSRLNIEFPEKVHFSTVQEVRIQDINYRKHLGHDKLIAMLHEARANYLTYIGVPEIDNNEIGYVLAELNIQYINEAFFGDELRFELSISDITQRSCHIYYRICKTGTTSGRSYSTPSIVALAKTGVVFFDYAHRKPSTLPDAILELTTETKVETCYA